MPRRGSSTTDTLTLYGDLLQRGGIIEPESSLPASKSEIKTTLIEEARRLSALSQLSAESQHEAVETMRTCYSLLAGFVGDDVVARNRGTRLQPDDLSVVINEIQRLGQEFDSLIVRPSSIPLPFTASQPTQPDTVDGDQKPWLGWLGMAALIVVAMLAGWALAVFMAWLFPSILGPVPY